MSYKWNVGKWNASPPPPPPLPPGICADSNLFSPSNMYQATVQPDGNLVVYKLSDSVFNTKTSGGGKGPYCLRIQADGNLGLIDSLNVAQWYSNSYGKGKGPYKLNMLDDGNLVLTDSNMVPIWSWKSGPLNVPYVKVDLPSVCADQNMTSPSYNHRTVMQLDGNFVVYKQTAMWSSNTVGQGKRPFCLRMQTDGNLGIYDSTNEYTWSSDSYGRGKGPYKLSMQDDGNLVIYDSNNAAIWSYKTGPLGVAPPVVIPPVVVPPVVPEVPTVNNCTAICNYPIVSLDKLYKAVVLPEGNVAVIYADNMSTVKWKSRTAVDKGVGPYTLKLKDNGDLVLVDSTDKIVWNTFTLGRGKGPNKLIMQNDGNLVLYDSTEKALWSSFGDPDYSDTCVVGVCSKPIVSANKLLRAVMKDDGNFVVTDGKTTLWRPMVTTTSSVIGGGYNPLTGGKVVLGPGGPTSVTTTTLAAFPGGTLNLQDTGDLVIKNASGTSVWSTGTSNKGVKPYKLVMQNDGNLVLYDNNDVPWWASKNGRIEHYYEETPCFPGGVRYRTVECRDDKNNVVNKSLCSSQAPPSKEICKYQSSSSEIPGSSSSTPGSSSATPGSSNATSGSSSETPGSSSETPGSSSETPGSSSETPGATVKPKSKMIWYIGGGVGAAVAIIILVIYLMKKKGIKSTP